MAKQAKTQAKPKTSKNKSVDPEKKRNKIVFITIGAVILALWLMALIWVLVVHIAPTDIKRVIFQSSDNKKVDESDRAKMIKVADTLRSYGVKKGDKFCLNYTLTSNSLSAYYSQDETYTMKVYWRDGTVQNLGCTSKNISYSERSRINSLQGSLTDILYGGRSYQSDYEPAINSNIFNSLE